MSSTEADPHTTEGWGIDWRKGRTWLGLAHVTLQLTLVAAMASTLSVGAAAQIWPLQTWPPFIFASLTAIVLVCLLFHGWAIDFNLRDGRSAEDRDVDLLSSASRTDLTIRRIWNVVILLSAMFLPVAFLELLGFSAETWSMFVGMAPATWVVGGFPYVVERLRQSAAKGPS